MFNKLRTRLTLLMIGITIFAIVLVSIITNITLFGEFNIYMKDEQDYKINALINFIENAYEEENKWSNGVLEKIQAYSLLNELEIIIRDNFNNIVLVNSLESDMMDMHREMMGRMGHSIFGRRDHMMNRRSSDDYKSYDIEIKDKKVGRVEIATESMLISEREVEFTRGINKSIIYAAIFAIITAFLLAQYFSKLISRPISKITQASRNISKGNLKSRIRDRNNIVELNELSNTINHLAKSLEEQKELRKRLTADVAHELRTPLTILYGQVEAITDGVWAPTTERMKIFKNEVSRLMKLVEQLKDLTEIETEEIALELEQFNFSQLVEEVSENFKYQFVSKSIDLVEEIEEDILIKGDKHRVSQILINLLSNALKFTNSGGWVAIRVSKKGETVILEIEDTGVGISKKDMPYLFERLYRVDRSRNKKTGGSGIGLTITKRLVEAHKGHIKVESEEGIDRKSVV